MDHLGIECSYRNIPELDPGFIPLRVFNRAFLREAKVPVGIAVERVDGCCAAVETFIHGTPEMHEADYYYIDRLVKTLLWVKGGFRIYVRGDEALYAYLKNAYAKGGSRDFDRGFMEGIYEHPFEVIKAETLPASSEQPQAIGGHLSGCRIGFDAGGSDRKVSAVIDGRPVYSEEVVWFPKTTEDPDYHYQGIVSAFRSAAAHLPRVDAVGISSAGIYINNRTMIASLFLKVPKELQEKKVRDIYIRAVRDTFGDVPLCVANDGDVTALAGAMSLEKNNLLGIAMGTSEAAGYVDPNGLITGWLNELAFAPVDANPSAMRDDWSGDIGVGASYFSQDSVIKLAPAAGIELDPALSPAEKLKCVQALMEEGDERAAAVYRSIGVYLAHSLAWYYDLYQCENVLLLGRVMSGRGGDALLAACRQVLSDEYPDLPLAIALPDEKFRRVGQSAVAASLPETAAEKH